MVVRFCRMRICEFTRLACFTLISIASASPLFAAQSSASEETPSSTYKANCTICHADDGAGTPLGIRLHAKDLRSKEVQSKPSEQLAQTIRAGKDNMPAFGSRLDSAQIDKLVQYVRTKKAKGH